MAANPKEILEKLERILNAWETIAPTKSFGGMTLAQFRTAAQPSLDARQELDDLEDRRTQLITQRDQADDLLLEVMQKIVNGVLGDPGEGPDSAIYAAFGYVRKSERKSGLTRKRNQPPTK